jgi:hypothetical protein
MPDGAAAKSLTTGERVVLKCIYAVKYAAALFLVVAAADFQFGLTRASPVVHFWSSSALLFYACLSLLRLRRFGSQYARRLFPVLDRLEATAEPIDQSARSENPPADPPHRTVHLSWANPAGFSGFGCSTGTGAGSGLASTIATSAGLATGAVGLRKSKPLRGAACSPSTAAAAGSGYEIN